MITLHTGVLFASIYLAFLVGVGFGAAAIILQGDRP